MNEPKHATGPKVKLQDDVASKPPPEPTQPKYEPMETARKDGLQLVVTNGKGAEVEARWHRTRRYDVRKSMWVEDGFWKMVMTGERLPFEPTGWRKIA